MCTGTELDDGLSKNSLIVGVGDATMPAMRSTAPGRRRYGKLICQYCSAPGQK